MKKGTHCFIDFTLCEIILGAFGVTFVWNALIDILKRALLFYFGTDFFLHENLQSNETYDSATKNNRKIRKMIPL